ncbi:exonuclease SbcCD subunit D [Candidatus Pacearchaeota archaeon]|nr:exonuclease SbcCD subunit D [Candidatus Pacearchaeota archaeon]
MVKFAHLSDCHLGSWRQGELQDLNFKSFQVAVRNCVEEKVDFVLISGDLFDSAYPPIEILKESFAEFKKLHDAKIPVYLIAGSHDFSASGKTFLDVLEKAGFCKNVEDWEMQEDGRRKLKPTFHGDIAIYGYPGRKSGMEVEDLSSVYFESMHQFTIFMIHTTIKDVVGTIPMESVEKEKLPLANYYAMGHIHQIFDVQESNCRFVYPGPIFPNNFQELSDLQCGSFHMVEVNGPDIKTRSIKIPLKEVVTVNIVIDNGLTATQEIISELDKLNLRDKIVLLKLRGTLVQGKTGDIRFNEIEEFVLKKGVSVFLRNISALKLQELEFEMESFPTDNPQNIEKRIMDEYSKKNPADFNKYLSQLMMALSLEKNEDEKSIVYEDRLLSELKNILELEGIL